jgi:hypothetical protein
VRVVQSPVWLVFKLVWSSVSWGPMSLMESSTALSRLLTAATLSPVLLLDRTSAVRSKRLCHVAAGQRRHGIQESSTAVCVCSCVCAYMFVCMCVYFVCVCVCMGAKVFIHIGLCLSVVLTLRSTVGPVVLFPYWSGRASAKQLLFNWDKISARPP